MNRISIIALFILLFSCQFEDESAPAPDETFIKYYGELTSYRASDIEIEYDATGEIAERLVIFGSKLSINGDQDYFILRTDLSGNLVDSASFSFVQIEADSDGDGNPEVFVGDEVAAQIVVLSNGGYGIVGTTNIVETQSGKDESLVTYAILDDNLALVDSVRSLSSFNPASLDLVGRDLIELSDGSLLLCGSIQQDEAAGPLSDFDGFYWKFNPYENLDTAAAPHIFPSSQQVFLSIIGERQSGRNERPARIFEKDNGNLVAIGSSNTPSNLGENEGDNGINVFYLEIDENGTPLSAVSYGLDNPSNSDIYNDRVSSAIRTAGGYTVVGTSSYGVRDETSAFVMRLGINGGFLSANNHDSSIYNGITTRGVGVVQAANGNPILVGQYVNFNFTDSIGRSFSRNGEGMFVQFNPFSIPISSAEKSHGLSDGDDEIVDAVRLPDGKIVAIANVEFGGGIQLITVLKMNANGSLD